MKIRHKTLISIALMLVVFIGLLLVLAWYVVLQGFINLEHALVERNLDRATRALAGSMAQLDQTVDDWAAWDDTYAFIQDSNADYISSNLVDQTFSNTGLAINFMLFFDPVGRLVYSKAFDLEAEKEAPVPAGLPERLWSKGLLQHATLDSYTAGLTQINGKVLSLSSRPIQTSRKQGPIRGTLIMGRYFTRASLDKLAETTRLSLRFQLMAGDSLTEDFALARQHLTASSAFVHPATADSIYGFILIRDIHGEPLLILGLDMERKIYGQGQRSIRYSAIYLAGFGLVLAALVMWILDRTVLSRVETLSKQVLQIGANGRLTQRVALAGNDEFAALAQKINQMLAGLARQEDELVRVERLRAAGELTAGVSHNLNNLLMGIMGPAELLLTYPDAPQCPEWTKMILASTRRAEELVQRLHKSVRRQEDAPFEAVSVDKVVAEAIELTRPCWQDQTAAEGRTIQIHTRIAKDAAIRGTESGLHEILVNLIINAIDALPEGGSITIAAVEANTDIHLSVHDTGIGMGTDIQQRVFEPFFTTKMDVGTGLGLSTAYRTVENWGGSISVASTPAQGTTFTLELPSWNKPVTAPADVPFDLAEDQGRFLIAEDEVIINRVITQMLEKKHHVESTFTAAEALERFTPGAFDVAIIDLGLPDLRGDQLAAQLKLQDPGLSTLMITGWTLAEDDSRLAPFDFMLAKPVDMQTLRQTLAQAQALHKHRISKKPF